MPLPSLPAAGLSPSLSCPSRQKQSEEMSGEALTVAAAATAAEEDDEIETEYDKIGRRGREPRERGEIGEG